MYTHPTPPPWMRAPLLEHMRGRVRFPIFSGEGVHLGIYLWKIFPRMSGKGCVFEKTNGYHHWLIDWLIHLLQLKYKT